MSQIPNQSTAVTTQPKWLTITGWVLTLLICALLTFSAVTKFIPPEGEMKAQIEKMMPLSLLPIIGMIEIGCMVVYLFPRTAVLGAALLNGYLGGAVMTHLRLEDGNFPGAIVIGVVMWLGIYLREPRLRAIMPWRT
ncbi:hypothetical protein ETAA8_59770 [Anatilimnocola aggregata]|uniref:DoxX family protein n=1 Tax=Anatilimnocola aggregata TaxID=2528021 RepID=A0A517YKV0_9BACT|nr:DoxX family protein [Anatilimnocola aggregata]QDU30828.1 hypothetical protein ETAA8_59770 [Anatilimnocola aggregata]